MAGDSGDGERILSIGKIAHEGFLVEMEFELGLDELGIGHEVGKEGENATSGWTCDIRGKWQQCRDLECGVWPWAVTCGWNVCYKQTLKGLA